MRILHVVPSIDPALGGVTETARQLTAAMLRMGVDAEVLSVEVPREPHQENWRIPVHGLGRAFTYYQYSAALVPWLRNNHSRYDAVLIHGIWRYPSVGVWRALRTTQKPYFLFLHGMLNPWFQQAYMWKHIKKSVFWRLLEHRVLRDARSVLFTSEAERALAREAFRPFRCAEHVIGMGTTSPPHDATDQLAAFYRAAPDTRERRNILFLGRLHRVKGCDLLIRAFARVAAPNLRFHLVIAGPDEGGLRPRLELLARELGIHNRITWTGQIEGAVKWGAFRAAEVFALPSHTENYGHAVVEAMACGVPVLITNKVNIWNEISADCAGFVEDDDLDGICALLSKWVLLDENQRNALRQKARNCFLERFDIDAFSLRLAQYLETVIFAPLPNSREVVNHG